MEKNPIHTLNEEIRELQLFIYSAVTMYLVYEENGAFVRAEALRQTIQELSTQCAEKTIELCRLLGGKSCGGQLF